MTIDSDPNTRYDKTKVAPIGETPYTAPAIEQFINAEEIEREVHYAGGLTCPTCQRLP